MVQLTTPQRVFIVNKYQNTKSYAKVKRLFAVEFPDKSPLSDCCIWKNLKKFNEHGTIINRNAKYSGRKRTRCSEENINTWGGKFPLITVVNYYRLLVTY